MGNLRLDRRRLTTKDFSARTVIVSAVSCITTSGTTMACMPPCRGGTGLVVRSRSRAAEGRFIVGLSKGNIKGASPICTKQSCSARGVSIATKDRRDKRNGRNPTECILSNGRNAV